MNIHWFTWIISINGQSFFFLIIPTYHHLLGIDGFNRSPLPQNNGNLPLPFFVGNGERLNPSMPRDDDMWG